MRALHVGLALALLGAACGGAVTPTTHVPTPAETGSTSPPAAGPTPSASEAAATPPAGSAGSTSIVTGAAPAPVEMKMPVPTAMVADLQALGLDAKNLPPMAKLEPKQLRGVMKLLARSLGVACSDCHQSGDFTLPTPHKKIATKMWDEFAAKLTMADGSPMFCDSCHQGHVKQLDRSDKKALGRWMDAAFVQGVRRKDGSDQSCESCHVGWDMTFLTSWAR